MQSSAYTSPSTPSTPSSPKPHAQNSQSRHHAQSPGIAIIPYKPDQLIRLKIAMRGKDLRPRDKGKGKGAAGNESVNGSSSTAGATEGIGTNIGTTRFLFNPPGFSGSQRPTAQAVN